MATQWRGAEAWIFFSIGDAAKSDFARLEEVLAVADANNHAIPTVTEFKLAVRNLLAAQLVELSQSRYRLTDAGKKIYEGVKAGRFGRINRTAAKWQRQAPDITEPVPFDISEKDFQRASEGYHRRFWETHRKQRRS